MKCFIPEALEIDRLISDRPPQNIERFHRDYLVYIPHLLTAIPAMDKGLELKNRFVPIKAAMLQNQINNYKKYLTYLTEEGVIESDGWYVRGRKCIGYRFTAHYSGRVRGVELQDQRIAKKLFKLKPIGISIRRKYGHLTKWYNSRLQIRCDLAIDFIRLDLERKLANPVLRERDARTGDFKNPITQYNTALCAIEKIAAGAFPISVDSVGYRLHSGLSNLRSDIRNCLTFNGLELVSIDIANSQPYLINLLLCSSFWENTDVTDALHCNELMNINRVFTASSLSSFIMIVRSLETRTEGGFQAYKELVRTGALYDYMEEATRRDLKISHIDRKAIKAAIFQVLFTDNRFIGQSEASEKRLFKSLFPAVYQILSLIKQKDKRNLPILLQRIESHLILKIITKRISQERRGLPLFTIHDSIITTAGNEEYIKGIIREEMEKVIGFGPHLRLERWAPENLCFSDGTPFAQTVAA